jgi:hypothetical protein
VTTIPIMRPYDQHDADVLDEAAEILQHRSRKPKGFGLSVAVGVLHKIAGDIRAGKLKGWSR